ncbi:type VI secretion system tube protein Hcp, partial [Vibrio sp. D173a]|nr:type VI secretion system tube protein Hcp [Vibrio sp. D173a]
VEILLTKPSRDGAGADPYLVLTLEKTRIASYNIHGSDGQLPVEDFSLTYTTLTKVYYQEGDGGKIEKGDMVKFDCTTGKLESKAA